MRCGLKEAMTDLRIEGRGSKLDIDFARFQEWNLALVSC